MARSADDLVRKYPKGEGVVVHYDPDNPQKSVLEKGVVRETFQLLAFGGIFLVAGLVSIWRGLRSAKRSE